MDHFTSLTPRERDETQTRSLTRRAFLGDLAAGAIAVGAVGATLALSAHAQDAKTGVSPHPTLPEPTPPAVKTPMTGAQYVAFLGGPVKPRCEIMTENDYRDPDARWIEIAQGPLIEAIDAGELLVCPKCLFVNYEHVPCQVCACWESMTHENIADYIEDLSEASPARPEQVERDLVVYRMGRAVDLYDGPDLAWFSGRMLYAIDYLRAKAA